MYKADTPTGHTHTWWRDGSIYTYSDMYKADTPTGHTHTWWRMLVYIYTPGHNDVQSWYTCRQTCIHLKKDFFFCTCTMYARRVNTNCYMPAILGVLTNFVTGVYQLCITLLVKFLHILHKYITASRLLHFFYLLPRLHRCGLLSHPSHLSITIRRVCELVFASQNKTSQNNSTTKDYFIYT